MLKIKLARFGKKNQPHYRIVVNEARDKRDGKYVALLGHYAPAQIPKILDIDVKAYQEWLKKGAQPTDTVNSLFERFKSGNPFPPKKAKPSKKALAKAAAKTEAKAEPETKTEPEVKAEPEAMVEDAVTEAEVETKTEAKPEVEAEPTKE
jgi:small subunit ribosomal protein S16